jgi:hypothetical protein
MKASIHAVASLGAAILLYLAFKSVEASVFCFIVGVFIDSDHFIDYLLWSDTRNLKEFFVLGPGYFEKPHLTDKFLHSIEVFSIFVILFAVALHQPVLSIGILVGFACHIVLDFVGFGFNPLHFFLLYRAIVEKKKMIALREAVLKKDGFKCKDCEATTNLQIHRDIHRSAWDTVNEWVTVCKECHIYRHGTGMFY